jgi:glycine cleavage system aminomethyltransferase T
MRVGEIVSTVYSPRFGYGGALAYIRTLLARSGMILTFDSGRVTVADAAQ